MWMIFMNVLSSAYRGIFFLYITNEITNRVDANFGGSFENSDVFKNYCKDPGGSCKAEHTSVVVI